MPRGTPWTRPELIVVFNLYCSLPFGQMHARNPVVIEMARVLGRTPGSLAMKLVNFASFDPAHQVRGVSGLKAASRTDREVWDEFHADWERLAFESEQLKESQFQASLTQDTSTKKATPRQTNFQMPATPPTGPSEAQKIVRVRTVQQFFRKAILAAYQGRCCVTGNPIPELLVASHILPWSKFPEHRINPTNGLCLAAHFDKAFDAGLITFESDKRLVLSSRFCQHLPNEALSREFVSMEGAPLRMPEKFQPGEQFLEYHREHIFR